MVNSPKPLLYRGTQNNGVHTVLTEEAVEVLVQRSKMALILGTHEGTSALLAIAARGTFTFVRADMYDFYRGTVTGTLEERDTWLHGQSLLPSPVGNYVPFSNQINGADLEFVRTPGEVIQAFGLAMVDAQV